MTARITINKKPYITDELSLGQLRDRYFPGCDTAVVNTVQTGDFSSGIKDGDCVYFFRKDRGYYDEDIKMLQFSRQPCEITERLQRSCVGIAGAGGLGSVVAETLARSGVGRIVIADFDIVEPSNLNRQRFLLSQIGRRKVDALAENIKKFTVLTSVMPVCEKLNALNCVSVFSGCSVVAECLDSPEDKAEIVSALRSGLPECVVVAVSGIAGTGCGNKIKTKKISDKFFLVGDMMSDVNLKTGLFASRVGIAASMQAHLIIRSIVQELETDESPG